MIEQDPSDDWNKDDMITLKWILGKQCEIYSFPAL
jgi:hypothetical protein